MAVDIFAGGVLFSHYKSSTTVNTYEHFLCAQHHLGTSNTLNHRDTERLDNLPKVTQVGLQSRWADSRAQTLYQYASEK